jgi:hypothetical protein
MGFILALIGLLMIDTGYQGTYRQFGTLVAGEFTAKPSFLYFVAGIGAVGAIGYIDSLRVFSRLFLTLILIGIVVSNKGFFANFQKALATGPVAPQAVQGQTALSSTSSTSALNSAISSNTSNLAGEPAQSSGQAKANGWFNYIFGTGTNSSGSN